MPRILAVDWGERRIGLAVSDPTGTIASGLPTLEVRSAGEACARVADVAAELDAEAIVVGLPLLLSGERGEAAKAAEAFAAALRSLSGRPVHTWDERLTSALAERRMHERGERVGPRRGERVGSRRGERSGSRRGERVGPRRGERSGSRRGKGRVDEDAALALLESWLAWLAADRRRRTGGA